MRIDDKKSHSPQSIYAEGMYKIGISSN